MLEGLNRDISFYSGAYQHIINTRYNDTNYETMAENLTNVLKEAGRDNNAHIFDLLYNRAGRKDSSNMITFIKTESNILKAERVIIREFDVNYFIPIYVMYKVLRSEYYK